MTLALWHAGMHNPRPAGEIRPRTCCYILQVKKYKKRLVNDGDFMNEFKLGLVTINLILIVNL